MHQHLKVQESTGDLHTPLVSICPLQDQLTLNTSSNLVSLSLPELKIVRELSQVLAQVS